MIGFFRRLIKDRRGNALLIAGAALPMIVGCAGLASDTIQWTLWKRQLQRAADSAALAAVYDRVNSDGSSATAEAAVSHDLTLNMHNWMALKEDPEVTFPSDGGAMTDQVQVVLRIQQRLPFSSMFMRLAPTITATARAAAIPQGGDPCFFATEPGTSTGLNYTGNAAIEAPDCDAFSNASGTNTSVAKGSSTVTLKTVGGVGGIQQSNNFHVGAYRPYSPALTDPFKDVNPDPADMKCAVVRTTTTTTVTVVDTPEQGHFGKKHVWIVDIPAVTHTETRTVTTIGAPLGLSDGMDITTLKDASGNQANCFTELTVGSNKTLTIPPTYTGPIYINGGDATFQGNFSCAACTIVLTNKDAASPIGNIKANAGANINISPPVDDADPFKGIAIFQDRRAADCNKCNKINGHSGSIIQGAIYFPSQELEYNGTGNTTAQCTMFIARRLNFSGNSATSNKFKDLADCGAFGLPDGATTLMVRLVA